MPNKVITQLDSPSAAAQSSIALTAKICGLSWSTQGDRLLAWTRSGEVAIINREGMETARWKAHDTQILKASWSFDNAIVATSGREGLCKLWHTDSGDCIAVIKQKEGWVEHLSWSPSCKVLLTGCSKHIRLWTDSGALIDDLQGHEWPLSDLCWHPTQSDLMASCAADGVCAWKLGTDSPIQKLTCKSYPQKMCFSRTGGMLAYGCSDGAVRTWAMGTGIILKLAGCYGHLEALDWSWGGQWMSFCGPYESYIWEFNELTPQSNAPHQLHGPIGRLRHQQFHPYEHLIATGGDEGAVYVWRTDHRKRSAPVAVSHHNSPVTALAWNPLGRDLSIGYKDGRIRTWKSEFSIKQG